MEILKEDKMAYYLDENQQKIYITNDDGKQLYVTDKFIDISYESRLSIARVLSNLFPYQFEFRGMPINSMEGLLQSLKYVDINIQHLIWKYSGVDAYHTRASSFIDDWRQKGVLYWQGIPMDRYSLDYQVFLNEAYLYLNKNPLFNNALDYTKSKQLLHSKGNNDPHETILTPEEYIGRLMILRDIAFEHKKDALLELSENIVKKY